MRHWRYWTACAILSAAICGTITAQETERKPAPANANVTASAPKEIPAAEPSETADGKAEKTEKTKEKTVEERVKFLETDWQKFKEAEEKKKAEAAAKNPPVKVSGRIHLDGTMFPTDSAGIGWFENPTTGVDPEDRLHFRRLRLTFSGDVLDNMLYKLDFEFANANSPEFRDAFFGFKDLPLLQTLLIGNQKRPLGLDHLNSSNVNVFMERPMVIDAFNEEARRIGIATYGYAEDESLNWTLGLYNLENVQNDGTYLSDPLQFSFNSRVSGTPWYDEGSDGRAYLHLGVANMVAHPNGFRDVRDTAQNEAEFRARPELRTTNRWINTGRIANADWFDTLGFESVLNLGPFSVVGEYQTTWVDRNPRGGPPRPDVMFQGYYVYLAYFLTGEHQPFDRKLGVLKKIKPYENFFLVERLGGGYGRGWGAWQVAVRYSYLDLTDADIRGGRESNVTFGLNWWFNQNARLMMNYTIGDIKDHAPVGAPIAYTAGNFTGLGMRLHIDF